VLAAPVVPDLAQQLWTSLGLDGRVADQRFETFQYEAPAQ